jgi:hypothetical protein
MLPFADAWQDGLVAIEGLRAKDLSKALDEVESASRSKWCPISGFIAWGRQFDHHQRDQLRALAEEDRKWLKGRMPSQRWLYQAQRRCRP